MPGFLNQSQHVATAMHEIFATQHSNASEGGPHLLWSDGPLFIVLRLPGEMMSVQHRRIVPPFSQAFALYADKRPEDQNGRGEMGATGTAGHCRYPRGRGRAFRRCRMQGSQRGAEGDATTVAIGFRKGGRRIHLQP